MKHLVKESLIVENSTDWHNTSKRELMTLNDFSEIMVNFYDGINDVKQFLDDDTISALLDARPFLNKAWDNEAGAHGSEFSPYPFL